MNKMLFVVVVAVLFVSACSDKDDASGKVTSSALDKAMETDLGAGIKDAASEAVDGARSMVADTANTVGDAASDAMEGASSMTTDAKTAVTDSVSNVVDGASNMVADAKTAVSESASSAMDSVSETASNAVAAVGGMADGGAAGQQVYKDSCQFCHAAGVAGAPKLGDKEAWAPRIALGLDALLASAINGKNVMPPRGACASCSDDDLKAAIEYMIGQSQ